MGSTVVKDYVVWAGHIIGDAALEQRILGLEPGQSIVLMVNGVSGQWLKMKQGKDGRVVEGIKPVGVAKASWGALYKERRGEVVQIEEGGGGHSGVGVSALGPPVRRGFAEGAPVFHVRIERADPLMQEAAYQALKESWNRGYRSEGPKMSRDEIYDRDEANDR